MRAPDTPCGKRRTPAPWRLAGQAPLVAKGKVIVSGNTPSGFIQAYDAETGRHLWTWNAIPQKAGDPGSDTWAGDSFKLGGGPVWVSGSYDPEQNVIFYGTGQPGSQWAGEVREGDNLYTDSIVAIDVDTGKIKWHFQNTPHDVHDWDSLEMPVLIDAPFRGQPRKLLVQANRNGFYYVLDRTNGKFLPGTPFVSKVNWASGLSRGRPADADVGPRADRRRHSHVSVDGGCDELALTGVQSRSELFLSRRAGRLRAASCGRRIARAPAAAISRARSPKKRGSSTCVRSMRRAGKKIWDYQQISSFHYGPGVLSTAGGLVFAGEHKGQVSALDARTGKSLWHFNTGDLITSSPISYAIDGQQYIAISSGTNVVAFGLP